LSILVCDTFVVTFNKSLHVVITTVRYIFVFHWQNVITKEQKKQLRTKCIFFLIAPSACIALSTMILAEKTKNYNRCLGTAERFYYNIPSFL
jgi:hypothetical protein